MKCNQLLLAWHRHQKQTARFNSLRLIGRGFAESEINHLMAAITELRPPRRRGLSDRSKILMLTGNCRNGFNKG